MTSLSLLAGSTVKSFQLILFDFIKNYFAFFSYAVGTQKNRRDYGAQWYSAWLEIEGLQVVLCP